jgi:HPt (histidine-containing phosphotransfer) domain-containing protein
VNPPKIATTDAPVFDANVLDAMFGTETAVIASVLQTFMDGTRSNLAELAHAVAAQDLANAASLAHKITGACRMSGALALGQVARKLEQVAKQGNAPAATQGLVELNNQWLLLQSAIGTQADE